MTAKAQGGAGPKSPLPDNFKVIMLSRHRSDTIRKNSLRLFPYATITVEESEVDTYVKAGIPKAQLLPHPAFENMPELRNWITDTVKAEFVIHVHDDLLHFRCLVGWRSRLYDDPMVVAQVLERTAICAKDAGCFLFGVGNIAGGSPHYAKHRPFRLNGYIRNVIGFVEGHGLRWDPAMSGHYDVDLSLQSLRDHRIVWRDERWAFDDARLASNAGGYAGIRTEDWLHEGRRNMLAKWGHGHYVNFRKRNEKSSTTEATVIRVNRRDPAVK